MHFLCVQLTDEQHVLTITQGTDVFVRLLATNLDRSAGESKSEIELEAAAGRFILLELEVEVMMGSIETEWYRSVNQKNKPIGNSF